MSVDKTLSTRGGKYGLFEDNAELAQELKEVVRKYEGWKDLDSLHKESLDLIFIKIARIINGDANYVDNWHDIQGYAKLVEDMLETPEELEAYGGKCEQCGQSVNKLVPSAGQKICVLCLHSEV